MTKDYILSLDKDSFAQIVLPAWEANLARENPTPKEEWIQASAEMCMAIMTASGINGCKTAVEKTLREILSE